jgi:uncharacterized protein (TIGR03032 family)
MATERVPVFTLTTSRGFPAWLGLFGGSVAFTTYQGNKVFFLGLKPDLTLSVSERSFPRSMGLAVSTDARTFFLATEVQIYRFDNNLAPGDLEGDADAVYAPHRTWITGDVDIHDMGLGSDGQLFFANTLFNCVATTAEGHSFLPIWQPPFIQKMAPEDCCHLNGLAMDAGQPRYVTCMSRSDVVDGWRDRREAGGVVIDVHTGEVVASGLSMPHSPRIHGGKLWLLNSGTGELGWVEDGAFHPLTFCPGYARGLTFAGHYAVVGISRARENRTFAGLALEDGLRAHDVDARTGLLVVDTRTGAIVEWVRVEGVIDELFDVAFLPGVRNPKLIGIKGKEINRLISIAPPAPRPVPRVL